MDNATTDAIQADFPRVRVNILLRYPHPVGAVMARAQGSWDANLNDEYRMYLRLADRFRSEGVAL